MVSLAMLSGVLLFLKGINRKVSCSKDHKVFLVANRKTYLKQNHFLSIQFSSIQSLSRVRLFVNPWTQHPRPHCPSPTPGVHPNPCSSSQWCHPAISSSVVPFSSCPSIPPSIRVFSNESALRMRWPKYWSFSFSISPSNEHPGLISFRVHWLDLLVHTGLF